MPPAHQARLLARLVAPAAVLSAASVLALTGCTSGSRPAASAPATSTASPGRAVTSPAATSPTGTSLLAGRPPLEVLAAARAALLTATTFRLSGDLASGGSAIPVDVRLQGTAGGAGAVTVDGDRFDLVRIGSTIWVRPPSSYYQGKRTAKGVVLTGKWLRAGTSSKPFGSFTPITSLTGIVDALLPPGRAYRLGPLTEVRGAKVIGLVDTTTGGTVYVAAFGPSVPLRVVQPDAKGVSRALDLLEFDRPFTVKPPASSIPAPPLPR